MHVVLFDIDGTLLSSGGAGQAAMEATFLAEFGASGEVHGISYAGRTDYGIVTDLFNFHRLDADDTAIKKFLQAYLSHLPEHLVLKNGSVLPGIRELLAILHDREDVLLGLLTGNFERGAAVKLGHFKIDHYFQLGGFGDRQLHRDDVAREALAAVRETFADVNLDRLWVIGDTPADVQCARAIGARAVAVCTGMYTKEELTETQPDHLFEDFADHHAVAALFEPLAS